jgi:D-sedoheptulose 7-phosphate isomerase
MLKKINNILTKEFLEVSKTIKYVLDQPISEREMFFKLVKDAKKSIKNKFKIIFLGNGGSAADAQHLATEIVVRYKKNRKAIPALAITTDTSALTAIGNDFSFNQIFSRQLEAIANKGDTVVILTTSGNSLNILEAIKFLKKRKINFFVIAGNKGGKASKLTKKILIVPSKETSVIQNLQMMYGHVLCEILEKS